LQRWCLGDLAEELARRGFDLIIDFASGLPTQDHLHQNVPPASTIIYSDYDPVTVEYGREILKDVPNVHIFQANAGAPESLLELPEVEKVLQGRRDVGLVMWGVSSFLTDDQMRHTMRYLYDWAGPQSCLVFQAQGADADPTDPANIQVGELYKKMGTTTYSRTLAEYVKLLQPWHPDATGWVSLLDWHGLDQSIMTQEDIRNCGPGGIGYGAYLVK